MNLVGLAVSICKSFPCQPSNEQQQQLLQPAGQSHHAILFARDRRRERERERSIEREPTAARKRPGAANRAEVAPRWKLSILLPNRIESGSMCLWPPQEWPVSIGDFHWMQKNHNTREQPEMGSTTGKQLTPLCFRFFSINWLHIISFKSGSRYRQNSGIPPPLESTQSNRSYCHKWDVLLGDRIVTHVQLTCITDDRCGG